jgi:hypothetical protein
MFIRDVIKKEDAEGELKLLYRMIEHSLGFVPPHFELFASIDIEAMKEFATYNQKMATHKSIDKNLLPHLRLEIAKRECRSYCVAFNRDILQNSNSKIDEKQELLMSKVLKSLYETETFNEDDLEDLQLEGFCDKDFFDLLNYATNFMAKSKMIEVYLKKDNT